MSPCIVARSKSNDTSPNQFLVRHLGQRSLAAFRQHLVRQLGLLLDQGVDLFLDRPSADEFMNQHVALLADAEGAVGGLVLHSRIPPAVEVDHMEAAVRFKPVPPALSDSTKNGGPSSRWKASTSSCRCATAVPPCSTSPAGRRSPLRKPAKRLGHLAELGEHQRLLLPRGDLLADFGQAGELAAVGRVDTGRRPAIGWDDCRFV